MRRVWGVALMSAILLCTGCEQRVTGIEKQLNTAIRQKCGTKDCEVRLRDLTPFAWDRMFYFDIPVAPAERQRIVGTNVETRELQRQIVFLDHGRVIMNEMLATDVERAVEGEIAFESSEAVQYLTCDDSARFRVSRETFGENGHFYLLRLMR